MPKGKSSRRLRPAEAQNSNNFNRAATGSPLLSGRLAVSGGGQSRPITFARIRFLGEACIVYVGGQSGMLR